MAATAQDPMMRRLAAYATERFPLAAYLPMILLASFAALGYSRVARRAGGFPPWTSFSVAAFTLLAAFFALRVADEHKDAVVDRLTRPELPVPRGLVTLGELRVVALTLALVATVANALLAPVLLLPLAAVAAWLALMTREFFARDWLRARPAAYLISHMVVMPLLLLHATAVDWLVAGAPLPRALWAFLAAAYATGLVLEIGRKIRSPLDERPGVETYSAAWGPRRAIAAWLVSLAAAAAFVALSSAMVGGHWPELASPLLAYAVSFAALRYIRGGEQRGTGKAVETASAAWTLGAYALLALPWVERALR